LPLSFSFYFCIYSLLSLFLLSFILPFLSAMLFQLSPNYNWSIQIAKQCFQIFTYNLTERTLFRFNKVISEMLEFWGKLMFLIDILAKTFVELCWSLIAIFCHLCSWKVKIFVFPVKNKHFSWETHYLRLKGKANQNSTIKVLKTTKIDSLNSDNFVNQRISKRNLQAEQKKNISCEWRFQYTGYKW